jgi:hypothetical protein
MSAMSHTNTTLAQSLRPLGRITGVLYLIIIVGGMYAGFVRPSLTTIGDPGATAAAIAASEGFFRSAILADLAMVMADVAIGVAFYYLLKATHQGLALLSGLFRLAQATTLGLNLLMLFLVLALLTGDVFAAAMGAESANAMAYLFLTAHGIGYNLALVFFAFSILIQGYLFIKSDLFPTWLGFLVITASLTYFVYTLASFFMPNFAAYAGGFEMMLVAVALPVELIITIWLLVRGVKGPSVAVESTSPNYTEAVSNA